ncbi:MAG TPA: hypothetical protein VGM89_09445, partial [Puia sp.]
MCYLCVIEPFVNYITQTFGIELRIEAVHETEQLPLFLKGNFLFFKGRMAGKMLLWAKVVDETTVTPEALRRQKSRLEQFFHLPVVFVFDQMDSWQRKRLIERQ